MLLKMLSEFLEKRTNQEISPKMKLSLEGDNRAYFLKRAEIEERILKETNWLAYFLDNVQDPELEDPKTLDDSDLLTIHQVFIEILKKSIDAHQENEPMCTKVLALYRKSKTELETRFADYPREDGFEDYLEARTQREGRSDARKTGEFCIFCGSEKIRSNGDKWQCRNCKKLFRKH